MAAPLFSQNVHRYDPYRTFKFQVAIEGVVIAGLSKMTALKKTVEAIKWTAAGDSFSHQRMIPGGTSYEPITLEAGLTHDKQLMNWANLVNNLDGDGGMSLKGFRKDLSINVLNMQGVVALSYNVKRAWVSEFQALPEMDANAMNVIGIQSVTLQHEGFSFSDQYAEPVET